MTAGELFYPIFSVIIVSLIPLVGIFTFSISEEKLKGLIFIFVSLATGSLFGDAIIHLLPETFEKSQNKLLASMLVLSGIFIFFVLEKFLLWKHEHGIGENKKIHPVGQLSLISDGLHNLIDGMLIGASYLVSVPVGVATTIAIIAHEIPQEMSDFAILLHAEFSKGKAIFFNLLTGTLAILGTIMALAIGINAEKFSLYMLPITAGGFIYIAGSDLIPELHKERRLSKSLKQLIAMFLGVALMVLLRFLG